MYENYHAMVYASHKYEKRAECAHRNRAARRRANVEVIVRALSTAHGSKYAD